MSRATQWPILVLGSKTDGGRAQPVLAARLRTAAAVAAERPGVPVVVSGRGESDVMARDLRQAGVDPARIVAEPLATSTNENLEHARRLFPDAGGFIVVTSNYHARRARLWAWHLGIPVEVIPAPTPKAQRRDTYLREVLALPHSATRIAWRRIVARLGR